MDFVNRENELSSFESQSVSGVHPFVFTGLTGYGKKTLLEQIFSVRGEEFSGPKLKVKKINDPKKFIKDFENGDYDGVTQIWLQCDFDLLALQEFQHDLKGVVNQKEHPPLIKIAAASKKYLMQLGGDGVGVKELSLLNSKALHALLKKICGEYSDEDVWKLCAYTCGHPYLAKIASKTFQRGDFSSGSAIEQLIDVAKQLKTDLYHCTSSLDNEYSLHLDFMTDEVTPCRLIYARSLPSYFPEGLGVESHLENVFGYRQVPETDFYRCKNHYRALLSLASWWHDRARDREKCQMLTKYYFDLIGNFSIPEAQRHHILTEFILLLTSIAKSEDDLIASIGNLLEDYKDFFSSTVRGSAKEQLEIDDEFLVRSKYLFGDKPSFDDDRYSRIINQL